MTIYFSHCYPIRKKKLRFIALCLLIIPLVLFSSACKKRVDYFDYVSELRSNIFLSKQDEFSLRVYAVKKEIPYVADGVPQDTCYLIEFYFLAPEGDRTAEITFQIEDKSFRGEMSFDNVKCEYYYSRTLDASALSQIECTVRYGEQIFQMTAISVKTEKTISPEYALDRLRKENEELFSSLTDKYGFAGEIYLRLIYEDAPYYYIGVIDREGKTNAFLMNAESGKILAKRQS